VVKISLSLETSLSMKDMSMVENSVQKIAERKKDILAAFAVSHF